MREKILIITDNETDQVNGVVTTFKNLESQALASGYSIVYLDPGQFRHCGAPGYPEVKLSWPWKIGEKIQAIDPTYIHIATEGPIGLAARLWLERKGWNYNTSYHTKFPEFVKKLYHIPESLTYAYLRWFHKNSHCVLTTTDTMVRELQEHNFKSNVAAWTRGVDREYLKPSVQHQPNKIPRVLYVGRVSAEKNLDVLCSLQDDYNVVIVGDGPDRTRLESRYPRVTFLGYLHGQELANEYTLADVFAFPSRTDTFGIVIIESLSCGTPVAAYPVPGPVDIIESGNNGFLDCDLKNAIEQCLSLSRDHVKQTSDRWTWSNCWNIFQQYLIRR